MERIVGIAMASFASAKSLWFSRAYDTSAVLNLLKFIVGNTKGIPD